MPLQVKGGAWGRGARSPGPSSPVSPAAPHRVAPRLTVVQEELGDGQERPHAGRVPAQPGLQGLQAGEGAVQEGGVLPAEHVQHQHGLHQALRGGCRGRVQREVSPGRQRASQPPRHLRLSAGLRPPSSGLLGEGERRLVSAPASSSQTGGTLSWGLGDRAVDTREGRRHETGLGPEQCPGEA